MNNNNYPTKPTLPPEYQAVSARMRDNAPATLPEYAPSAPTTPPVVQPGMPTVPPVVQPGMPTVPPVVTPGAPMPPAIAPSPIVPPTPDGMFPTPSLPPPFPSFPSSPVVPPVQIAPLPPLCLGCPVLSDRRYCKIRFLHAIPGFGPVNINLGITPVIHDLTYGAASDYIGITSGYWTVSIFSDTDPNALLYKQTLPFDAGEMVTLAIVLSGNRVDLLPISASNCMRTNGNLSRIRFANLSYISEPIDIITHNNQLVAGDVNYKNVTPFKLARPGSYTFHVMPTNYAVPHNEPIETLDGAQMMIEDKGMDGSNAFLTFTVDMAPNSCYTVYLVGNMNNEAPLQVVVLEE